jgi:phage portal protein BeeE
VSEVGFLSGIFKSRDAPSNGTNGSTYSFFMGSSSAGKRVNERSAMQMTAVYACVRVISESIASLPLHLYKFYYNERRLILCREFEKYLEEHPEIRRRER